MTTVTFDYLIIFQYDMPSPKLEIIVFRDKKIGYKPVSLRQLSW